MEFIETRGNEEGRPHQVPFSEAILNPNASFGGLYVPKSLPKLDLEKLQSLDYKELAFQILKEFNIDISDKTLQEAISLYDKFDDPNEPVPLVDVGDGLYISELYHGPTRAFKDMALQPFGKVLSSLAVERDEEYLILVATSGDTGPATLETFKNRPNIKVVCLYPYGGTSDVQRLQMVTEDGENLKVIGIRGSFDDAQTTLKNLLRSADFRKELEERNIKLSAANSVNFGRIIFQTIYHIYSYLQLVQRGEIELGEKIYITVPSGNFGNALGGFYAQQMGLPIEKIFIASNENNILTDFITTGKYSLVGRNVVNTKSPAMDILKSSNVERVLFALFGAERTKELMEELENRKEYQLTQEELEKLQNHFSAVYSTDSECIEEIRNYFQKGYLMDTHTATNIKAHRELREKQLKNIAYSTAEWTKFSPSILEALEGVSGVADREALEKISQLANIPIPHQIQSLFEKEIAHKIVVPVPEIEKEILNFI